MPVPEVCKIRKPLKLSIYIFALHPFARAGNKPAEPYLCQNWVYLGFFYSEGVKLSKTHKRLEITVTLNCKTYCNSQTQCAISEHKRH